MTVLGKCDTCRARKVKCDEERPICGACSARSRVCSYSFTAPDSSNFVYEHGYSSYAERLRRGSSPGSGSPNTCPTSRSEIGSSSVGSQVSTLRLQCVESLGAASGLYITFKHDTKSQRMPGTRKSKREPTPCLNLTCAPSAGLICSTTAQSSRYGSIFGVEALDLNPLGQWLQHAWYRAAEASCVQIALDYTHEAMIGFQHRDDAVQASRIFAVAQKALRSLQSAINAMDRSVEMRDDLIIAIMLHYAAEHFTSLGTFNYVPHMEGVIRLLKANNEVAKNQIMRRNVLKMICVDETVECLFRARASAFEDIPKAILSASMPHDLGIAHEAAAWLLVQTPGLVCLVRALDATSTASAVQHAFRGANQLWDSEADCYVRQTLEECTSISTQPVDTAISPTERVLDFCDQAAFVLATRYYFYRMILCGVLQTLHRITERSLDGDFYDLEAVPDLKAAENGDVAAATSTLMSLHYAVGSKRSAMPLTALAMVIPMEFSIGTWNRLQRRQEKVDSLDHQHAVHMRNWTLEQLHRICNLWKTFRSDYGRVSRACDVFAGGPVFDGVCAMRDRSLYEAKQQFEQTTSD